MKYALAAVGFINEDIEYESKSRGAALYIQMHMNSTAMPTMRIPTGKFASVVLPHLMQTTNLIRLPVLVPVVLPSLVAIPPRMSPLLLPAWLV